MLFGGRTGNDGSLWHAPTVIEGTSPDMDLAREKTFGPVLPIVRVRDEDDALRRINEEGPNLTTSVWTADIAKGRALDGSPPGPSP